MNLDSKISKVWKLLLDIEKSEEKTKSFRLQLGEALVDLQKDYYMVYGKNSGFVKWAAKLFKISDSAVANYMVLARDPTRELKNKIQKRIQRNRFLTDRTPLDRIQERFLDLSLQDQVAFTNWIVERARAITRLGKVAA